MNKWIIKEFWNNINIAANFSSPIDSRQTLKENHFFSFRQSLERKISIFTWPSMSSNVRYAVIWRERGFSRKWHNVSRKIFDKSFPQKSSLKESFLWMNNAFRGKRRYSSTQKCQVFIQLSPSIHSFAFPHGINRNKQENLRFTWQATKHNRTAQKGWVKKKKTWRIAKLSFIIKSTLLFSRVVLAAGKALWVAPPLPLIIAEASENNDDGKIAAC